jgi:hypothetical protein
MLQINFVDIQIFLLNIQIGILINKINRMKGIKNMHAFRFILADHLNNYQSRSEAVAQVLNDMRAKDCLKTLRGWRDEVSLNDITLIEKEKIIIFY